MNIQEQQQQQVDPARQAIVDKVQAAFMEFDAEKKGSVPVRRANDSIKACQRPKTFFGEQSSKHKFVLLTSLLPLPSSVCAILNVCVVSYAVVCE